MLVVTLLMQPAYAGNVTISFTDLQVGRNLDIQVYQPSASGAQLVAETNSTGTIELDTDYDYVFVVRPAEDVWFQNPLNAIELLRLEMPVFVTYLLFVVVIVGGFYVVFRRL